MSYFNMLFRSSRWFERRKQYSRTAKFCNFHLEGLFFGKCLQFIIMLISFTLELKMMFSVEK